MTHTLAADFGASNLDAATIANDALVTNTLVLAAVTFPIACGTKNAFAE